MPKRDRRDEPGDDKRKVVRLFDLLAVRIGRGGRSRRRSTRLVRRQIGTRTRQRWRLWRYRSQARRPRPRIRKGARRDLGNGRWRWLRARQRACMRGLARGSEGGAHVHDVAEPGIDHDPHLPADPIDCHQHVKGAAPHRPRQWRKPGGADDGHDLIGRQGGFGDGRARIHGLGIGPSGGPQQQKTGTDGELLFQDTLLCV